MRKFMDWMQYRFYTRQTSQEQHMSWTYLGIRNIGSRTAWQNQEIHSAERNWHILPEWRLWLRPSPASKESLDLRCPWKPQCASAMSFETDSEADYRQWHNLQITQAPTMYWRRTQIVTWSSQDGYTANQNLEGQKNRSKSSFHTTNSCSSLPVQCDENKN